MKIRMIISGMFILCGSVLIVLAFHSSLIWDEDSKQFYNLSEAGLVYGLLIASLGIVLMFYREMRVFSFLWISWIGMFAIQLHRMYPVMIFKSHFMNSAIIFWGTIALGVVLAVATIIKKSRSIF